MLRIQVNKSEQSVTYEKINGWLLSDGSNIIVPTEEKKYSVGDTVYFERMDGKDIDWTAERLVKNVETVSSSSYRYETDGFSDIMLDIASAETKEVVITPGGNSETVLFLHLNKTHDYVKNRDKERVTGGFENVLVRGQIGCSMYGDPLTDVDEGCAGDYVIFNNYFLYKTRAVNADGKYIMTSAAIKNYTTNVWYYDGENKVVFDAIVPCTLGGRDIRDMIILRGDSSALNRIAETLFSYTFYGKDERFFTENGEVDGFTRLVLTQGTTVSWRLGEIRITIPASGDFATDGLQEDAISQYIEEASALYVNPIIDYEKQQFIPVYDGKDVSKIIFTVNLRERDSDWNTNDNFDWNDNNLIWNLGFDEDDIYYRKKKVTETFLRVSIYDNRSRARQKLLYTAKIYLNAGDLYGRYVDGDDLDTEFVCTHKYDYYNSTEGFYFHLFPSNLENNENGIVYMKCELNNAKYGRTIPLAWNKKDGYIVPKTDESGNTIYEVDMKTLSEDVYIPIKIDKDEENNRYTWEFDVNCAEWDDENASNTLTLYLYEPRINHGM